MQVVSDRDAALRIEGVQKGYEGHMAVRSLSLTVPRGSVYGLLGPNGAGKTTTIRMIMNIIAPDAGTIRLLGAASNDPRISDRVGYLPEERGLYRKMRVREVLIFLGRLKGVPRHVLPGRVDSWLDRLQLRAAGGEDWGKARVDELSRGMQQKVQFIGALLHEPELVILDEPFSGLDPVNAQALKDTVVDMQRQGRTVVLSTHVMDNAERMCDAVCIIANGEKVLDGTVREVRASRDTRVATVVYDEPPPAAVHTVLNDRALVVRVHQGHNSVDAELAPAADAQELLARLVAAGARLERFELVRPSLHRIFLEKVGAHSVETGMTGHG